MNPAVAVMIASLACSDPALSFREFYARFYAPPSRYQTSGLTVLGYMDAQADWLEYRVARMEKCGGGKR